MDGYKVVLVIQYVAIAILFAELIYAVCQKPSEMRAHVVVLTIATILMFVGYIIELNSVNVEEALSGAAIAYLGKPYVMCASFMFVCAFYGKKVSKGLFACLATFCLLFPVIVFTNEYHHLYYATVNFDITQKYSPLSMTRGPLYYIYVATSVVYFLACIIIILANQKNLKSKNRKKLVLYSIMMIVSGILGYGVYLLGITDGYDSTMMGVFFGVVFLFIIFLRFKVLDALSLAKEYALDDASVGLIVMDDDCNIQFTNEYAKKLMSAGLTVDYIKSLGSSRTSYVSGGRMFSLLKKRLSDDGYDFGYSLEINDITYVYDYQTRLEHDVKERTEKLESIQRSIIASVANLIEARNMETGEHIKRTSEYTGIIAAKLRQMGKYTEILTDEYIDLLIDATPLHDVGKIGIPDAILLKPGKLTPEEFEVMKTHVSLGPGVIQETLGGLESEEYIQIAKDIALFHHEWWNGTGYTSKLKGEEIPLSARIVAVADNFDALISERCYKPKFSIDDAVAAIRNDSGTHFDPVVVEAFIEALKDAGVVVHN